MQQVLQNPRQRKHVMEFARTINNLFSFAGIGVSGGFQQFAAGTGPPAVAITGLEQRLAYITRERRFQQREQEDAEENDDEFEPTIKLPASFVGSHAWTSEQAADAMALGRKFGKPTFFMTMTFNPDWAEVRDRLLPGQTAYDIPIVVARAFKSRLEKVLRLLRTRFGEKKYLIKVIEFQKRGFPHAHILLKVRSSLLN